MAQIVVTRFGLERVMGGKDAARDDAIHLLKQRAHARPRPEMRTKAHDSAPNVRVHKRDVDPNDSELQAGIRRAAIVVGNVDRELDDGRRYMDGPIRRTFEM